MRDDKKHSTDRRAVYTRKVIKEAFAELMEEYPIEKITVSRICRNAEINRSTFYLHYRDVTHVYKEIEEELYQEMVAHINLSLSDEKNRMAISNTLYVTIKDNPIYRAFGQDEYIGVFKRVIDYAKRIYVDLCVKSGQLTKREAEIWAMYNLYGSFGLVLEMKNNGFKTIEEDNLFGNKVMQYGNSILDISELNKYMKE